MSACRHGNEQINQEGHEGKWEDWMLDGEGIENGVAKEPSRKMVAEWLLDIYKNIPSEFARNA